MRSIGSCVRTSVGAAVLAAGLLSSASGAKPAGALFDEAQEAEKRLQRSASRLKKKSEWIKVARMYRQVVVEHPKNGYSDDSLYFEAELYHEIGRRFRDEAAIARSLDSYLQLAEGYPSSKWAPKARLNRAKMFLESLSDRKSATAELREVVADWPGSTEASEARRILDDMTETRRAAVPSVPSAPSATETFPPGVVGVRNVRHWTGREYTRIVIDLDEEVKFQEGRLEDPARIYFDLQGARVTKDLADRRFHVGDGFLQQIRVGQFRNDVVRVVLDFQNVSQYNVFSLPDPYRLVVDILGQTPPTSSEVAIAAETKDPEATAPAPAPDEPSSPPPAATPVAEAAPPPDIVRVPPPPRQEGYSLVQQLGLAASRIVIDAGHGGHDPGTMNNKGLREKDIVLDISQRVSKLLETDGFDVVMTRDGDVFIPLEERTAIANSREADLFVSIHVNASRSAAPRGIETYYLNLATTPDAEEVAARENAVTTRRLGELQSILQKVMNNSRITESRELASRVQREMSEDLLTSSGDSRNRGVKTAPFYVLLGAQMPSVLVEVAYLTNRKDAALLADSSYRQKVAESIASGVRRYQDSLVRTTKADASGTRLAEGK